MSGQGMIGRIDLNMGVVGGVIHSKLILVPQKILNIALNFHTHGTCIPELT